MKTYLMTRGTARANDYQFIGDEPADRWWAPVADQVLMEEAELIVAGRDGRLCFLLSGVPSARRDVIGTEVRYTVVVEDVAADLDVARKLLTAGLTDAGRARFGELLDKSFGGTVVDEILGGAARADVPELVGAALRELPGTPAPADGDDGPRSWAGPWEKPDALDTFRRRVERLAAGGDGYAFTTHLLSTLKGAEAANAAVPDDVAILLVDGTVDRVTELGKAGPGPGPGPGPAPGRRVTLVIGGLVMAAGALIWVLWWIARRLF
ncbi:hypothetical protein AB0M54_06340 [Actinoplanes sp. NPDC051470]|uniref:hypothetical protein n=1 Tax=Actinoplanes sp. NPDC051470 TaxID=3157224 RepID=UPI003424AEF1